MVGALGPNFETTVVDGNLVALLPRSPNFEDYSDAGLLPAVRYTVDFADLPGARHDPDARRASPCSPRRASSSTRTRIRDSSRPGAPSIRGPLPGTSARLPEQLGEHARDDAAVRLRPRRAAALPQERGPPQVIWDECSPQQGDEAVGTPSAITPGLVNLPALRVRMNEPLDPMTVVPWYHLDQVEREHPALAGGRHRQAPRLPRSSRCG